MQRTAPPPAKAARPRAGELEVAVVIAAKDAEQTVGRAVGSALAEARTAEVVVVDDGSSDDTSGAARAADDGSGRLKVIRLPRNLGPAAARNLAIAQSTAPYIAILDSDDFWLPGRLDRLALYAPGCDLIADDLSIVAEEDDLGCGAPLIGAADGPFDVGLTDFLEHNISRKGSYRREWGFLKPVIRRAFLEQNGLAYDPELTLGEDFVLYAQALARGARFRIVGACGYVAVERRNSLTATHSAAHLGALLAAARKLSGEPMAPGARAVLKRYLWRLKAKTRYRQLLDARRSGGLRAVASMLLSDLDMLPSALVGRLQNVAPTRFGGPRARPHAGRSTARAARPGC